MFELKPLAADAVPRALDKAERYRLLNEPGEAESICEDVLRVDPENERALVTLLLALTDQFDDRMAGCLTAARGVVARLAGDYERAYYAGIISERQGKAQLRREGPVSSAAAHECLREAMELFERAAAIRPPGNDDALLRWNACARLLMRTHADVRESDERFEAFLE